MASVFKRDDTWVVKWKDGAGRWRQQRTDFHTRLEAVEYGRELDRKATFQRAGLEPLERPPALTFGELLDWYEAHFARTLKSRSDLLLARRHLRPALGQLALVDVTAARIDEVLSSKAEELSAKTLNNLRAFVQAVFSRAIQRKLWNGPNPAKEVPRRKVPRRIPAFLRPEEVTALLAHLEPEWRGFFATAVYTGMRRGEVAALEKRDVDLEAGTITVTRSWTSDTTKGGRARVIPIHPELRPYLVEAMRKSPSALVFPRPDGSMHRMDTNLCARLRAALNRAHLVEGWLLKCRRCGHRRTSETPDAVPCPHCSFRLWPSPIPRKLRFHDLRHTTATLLLKAGVPLAVVQRILGHQSPQLTADVYGHLDVADLRAGIEKLSFAPSASPVADVVPPGVCRGTVDRRGAPVVRSAAGGPLDAPPRPPNSERLRAVEASGPTRIRTWNQAVMSRQLYR